jgi:outer membrane immunogenic protein
MIKKVVVLMFAAAVAASPASAQTWRGLYFGGTIGGAWQMDDADERVEFDTNLDGVFTDTVRTAAGADAFSPGFCGGIAAGTTPQLGCSEDENGIDFGGRAGYDWQTGAMVFGAVAEISRPDVGDGVTAFSTTPAFYAFDRKAMALAGFRGRVGAGSDRWIAYGTGGLAWGWVEQTFTTSNAVNTFVAVNQDGDGSNQSAMGYQAGGGLEFRLGARTSLVAEYLFTSLDNREESAIRSQGPAPATNPFILTNAAGTELRRSERFDLHSLRFGVNFRF